jgi:L-histidine N-alpha-methyltransferase
MLTEVSCKFRPDGVAAELAAAGLRRTDWWTDPAGDFGLSLAVK